MTVTQSYQTEKHSALFSLEERRRPIYALRDDLPVLVGMDFNGLIADKPSFKSAVISEVFDTYIPPKQCSSDYIKKLFKGHAHRDRLLQLYRHETENLLRHPKFIEAAKPVPGALENIEYLLDRGTGLAVITSEGNTAANAQAIAHWFEHYTGFIPYNVLALTDHKPKFPHCQVHNVGAFLDNELPKALVSGAPLVYVIDVHGVNNAQNVWRSWYNEFGVPQAAHVQRDLDALLEEQTQRTA